MKSSQKGLQSRTPSLPKASRANVFRTIWEIIHGDENEHLTQDELLVKEIRQAPQALAMLYFLRLLEKPGIRRVEVIEARAKSKSFSRLLKDRVVAEYPKLLTSDDPSVADPLLAKELRNFGTSSFVIPSKATTHSPAKGCLNALNEIVVELGSRQDGFNWLERLAEEYTSAPDDQDSNVAQRNPSSDTNLPGDGEISPEGRRLTRQVLSGDTGIQRPKPQVLKFAIELREGQRPKYAEIKFDEPIVPAQLRNLIMQLEDQYAEISKPLTRSD